MENSITAQYWIGNKEESIAAAFLLERDYIIYKLHCGEAMPITGVNTPNEKSVKKVPEPLKVGDRVSLNSGGPAMTITSINDIAVDYIRRAEYAAVNWFDDDGKVQSSSFPVAALNRGL